MKATELRIGNWVHHKNKGDFQIKKSHFISIVLLFSKPIPLTDEWLIKFGFEFNEVCDSLQHSIGENFKWFHYDLASATVTMQEMDDGELFHLTEHINYVHQLQNLYFALSGEELIISES